MQPITSEALIGAMQWRYATKHFDAKKKISATDWAALEQALHLSPSSFGLQPWKFVVVQSPELRKQIRAVAWNQPQIEEASHLVVFCAKTKVTQSDVDLLIARIAEVRGVPPESLSEYRGMMLGFLASPPPGFDSGAWAARQTYLAFGAFLTAAATLGVDACPMEGFDPLKVNDLLGLSAQGYAAVVMATAGYRSPTDTYAGAKKVRFERAKVIESR